MKEQRLLEIQNEKNNRLAGIFNNLGIKNVIMTSLGNSIGAGYSTTRKIKPLLMRNESLDILLNKHNIKLERHSFARAQNNADEHIYDWLISNIKESEMNNMVRRDYSGGATSMASPGITAAEINEYYPLKVDDDKGLNDIITKDEENLANIVIYNGCTGSFLDNVTRGGKIRNKLVYGVKRDLKSLEAILKYIHNQNRISGKNTQVYLCGAPNWLGIHLTDILNRKLKQIAKEYANVTYVDSVPSKFFYKKIKDDEITDASLAQSMLSSIPLPDPHYDEGEYLKFNNNIIEAINNNYVLKQALINIDRNLYRASLFIEKEGKSEFREEEFQKQIIKTAIENEILLIEKSNIPSSSLSTIKKQIINYVINRFPYDFYYLGKKNIKSVINDEFITK